MVTAQDCLKKYGAPHMEKAMKLWVVPEDKQIGPVPARIYCNKDLPGPLCVAIDNLIEKDLVKEFKTWDGCFNIRKMRGSDTMSLHSWGIAIDVNAKENGLGKEPKLSKEFVKCFTDAGFQWGGNFARRDGMHFQLAKI